MPQSKLQLTKPIISTPKQFQLEVSGFQNTKKKVFRGFEKLCNNFIKPGLKLATPIISAGVAGKTKNPQSAQIFSNFLKTLTGGKILSLTDMHGRGLCLKAM